jgi:hypothetical protein
MAEPPPPGDPVAQLDQKLARGEVQLAWRDDGTGYLASVLQNLGVPVDSQLLVFSKTSLQVDHITPHTPRAVYFNDDVAVGAVQDGRIIELIATDPKDGLAFYTLPATKVAAPRFQREGQECTACHGRVNRWAQAMIVANVIPQDDGTPLFVKTDRLFDVTDHRTPYADRLGGWYVTGTHGAMTHAGNVHSTPDSPGELDPRAGQNVTDLSDRIDVARYLAPSSDIVAIMTLEHQVGATNLIQQINGQIRSRADSRLPADQRATQADIDASIAELSDYLMFVGEPPLPSPVKGVSDFAERFAARGPRDDKGRSLRALDLKTRLARYPLSWMIYSRAFQSLDAQVRAQVYRNIFQALQGEASAAKLAAFTPAERRAALEIAAHTGAELPDAWRTAAH